MAQCPSPETIARYRDRALGSPEELRAVDAHLATCSTCSRTLREAAGDAATSLVQILGTQEDRPDCPADDLLLRFVDGRADAAEAEIVEIHAEDCSRCTEALAALRSLHTEMQQFDWKAVQTTARPQPWYSRLREWFVLPSAPRFALATAGLAALALLVGFWTTRPLRTRIADLQAQQGRLQHDNAALRTANGDLNAQVAAVPQLQSEIAALQRQSQQLRQENVKLHLQAMQPKNPSAPPASLALADGDAHLQQDAKGRLSRVEPLPAAVQDAWKGRRLKLPVKMIAALIPADAGERVRGGGQGEAFTLRSPVGTAAPTERPTFRWTPMPGATGYRVSLDGIDASENKTTPGTEWTPTNPLQRGRVYSWVVTAYKGDEPIARTPSLAAPPAKFKILDATTAQQIERAQQSYAGSPLTLGVLYAQAGLLDEAEQQLQAVAKANPRSEAAKRLLQEVQKLRRRSP